ncbi:MAG: putative bifunctional diguanylate cyclase/phosphodiesterase [Bacillota bacterium]
MKHGLDARQGAARPWLSDPGTHLTILLGIGTLLFLVWQVFRWGDPAHATVIADLSFLPVSLSAALLMWRAAGQLHRDPIPQRAWRLIGLAFFLYWIGDAIWMYYEAVLGIEPSPSLADLFYLLWYLPLLGGLLSFPAAPQRWREKIKFALDAFTILVSGWMVVWHLVIAPVVDRTDDGWLAIALGVAYPVGDLLMLFGVVWVLLRHRRHGYGRALGLLASGLFLILLGDLAYGRMSLLDTYTSGSWPDSLWIVGQYLTVVAAQYLYLRSTAGLPTATMVRLPRIDLATAIPYLAMVVSYGLLLGVVRLVFAQQMLIIGAVAVTLAVAGRQLVMLRENTELLQASAALTEEVRRSENRFRSLVQRSFDVIAVVDEHTRVRYISPSLRTMLGRDPDQVQGTPLTELIHPEDVPIILWILGQSEARGVECRLLHADGTLRYAETQVNNLLHDPGVHGVVLNVRDITERKRLEDQLKHQAFHDALTSLANRALLRDRVERALQEQRRRQVPVTVMFLDLDGFKTVNDSLGHSAGDQLLKAVAERLVACVEPGDTVARLGGDEFAILLEGGGEEEALRVVSRIRAKLAHPFTLMGKDLFVYSSIGIAQASPGVETVDELLRNADVAMYNAKGQGTGRYAFFEPDMAAAAVVRLELEAGLRWAVESQQFVLRYQPTVDLTTGRICSVEALVRWAHPERGLILPGEFIGLAEETGLIIPLGRWVLRESCRQLGVWRRAYPSQNLSVSVNLSARQLNHPGLLLDVAVALEEHALPPGSLTLEITESVLMQSTANVLHILSELRKLGVRLAIDDFGIGYSSLSYLQRFPVDLVKIDRSFVEAVGRGFKETALVRGIIDLSHALGLMTVAEGIEQADQAEELRRLNCRYGQGYYFSRPLEVAAVEEWLVRAR